MKKSIRSIAVLFTILATIFFGQFSYAQEENSTTLETGIDFREDLGELAGGYGNIEKIKKSTQPLDCLENVCKIISAEGETEVQAMYSGSDKTIYYYTEAEKIYLNPSSANMFSMFTGLTQVSMTPFDTSKVTDMSSMFYNCKKLENLSLNKFDTSNVTNMSRMFYGCSTLTSLNVSKFTTSKVTDMSSMFQGCSNLTTLNISGLVMSGVNDVSNMFRSCSKLTTLNLSKFDTSTVTDMNGMFYSCSKLTTLNISSFDTKNVTDMSNMFRSCSNLTGLNISSFDTKNVTDMNNMFRACSKLTSLDVSNFDTSNVTNMSSMFNGYKGKNLDLSNFNTSKVTDMNGMFNGYSGNVLDLSSFDTKNVTDMNSMFYNCNKITNLDVSNFDTSKVEDVHGMFNGCSNIEELDLTLFNTMSVANMNNMFNGCSKLTTIYVSNSFVLDNVISSTDMFKNDKKLVGGNGTQYTGTHVTGGYAVIDTEEHPGYFSAKDKESIFLPGEKFNVKIKSIANGTGMTVSSIDSEITSITRSYNPSTGNLEIISILGAKNPIYAWYDSGTIFYYTESEEIYMNPDSKSMFQGLSSLKNLDLKDVHTDNATDMRNMFNNCSSLETLDLSNFDTSNVTNMSYMLNNCSSLETLDLSNFDTSNVTNMNYMFNNCSSLETLDLSNFDTSSVTNMNYMFNGCESLKTLNLENFNTSNAGRMRNAFSHCKSLEILNLESFDTNKVDNMNQMFYNMSNIKTIYVSDNFVTTALSGSTSSKDMFSGDINIVGGNGTVYDNSMVESGYARIDKEGQPGYFTDILDKTYNITYNLDGGNISGEKTTYTQRDSFTLPIPTKEGYTFSGWVGSNGKIPEIEVTIPEHTKGDLEYTAIWGKIEESEKSDSNKSSGGGGISSKTSQSAENEETKIDEKEQNGGKTEQGDNTENYNPDYSLEQNEAYQFAYNNGITTMPTIAEVDMNGPLNRIAMAKMLSNYAINILGKKPSNSIVPKFKDITQELDNDYGGAVTLSYQLGIMGINIEEFRPFDIVTRGEFATALSRMLFGIIDGENIYYEPHIKKLFEEKIISVTDPKMEELRGYVMIMLMRSARI